MTKPPAFITAFVLTISLAGAPAFAAGYTLDAKGKCHDDHGRFAKASFCKAHTYKLDKMGKCHDETGKFADKKFCPAH